MKLVAKSDVVIENFKTGTLDKWGIGVDEMKKVNPNIIDSNPPLIQCSCFKVFDHDITFCNKLHEKLLALFIMEIQCNWLWSDRPECKTCRSRHTVTGIFRYDLHAGISGSSSGQPAIRTGRLCWRPERSARHNDGIIAQRCHERRRTGS